jgi:2-polyprenylphenol hydroxylase and related flavodoxin oxidoreductases
MSEPVTAAAHAAGGTDPMRPERYRVVRTWPETHDTFTMVLAPVEAGTRYRFAPGQFNMLYLPGVGEAAISMSGDPDDTRQVVHTVRAVGRVTKLLQGLKRGDEVGLRGPFGTPWPVDLARGRDVLLVAGGIGLAPLRPVVHHLLRHREQFGHVCLLFGARTPQDVLFQKDIETWRGRFDVSVEVSVDRAGPEWHGRVGVVTTLIPHARVEPSNAIVFICGPEIMMHFTMRELERRDLAHEQAWVSMERNMKCGVGFCGHCQFGPLFVCKDGPVFRYDRVASLLPVREV